MAVARAATGNCTPSLAANAEIQPAILVLGNTISLPGNGASPSALISGDGSAWRRSRLFGIFLLPAEPLVRTRNMLLKPSLSYRWPYQHFVRTARILPRNQVMPKKIRQTVRMLLDETFFLVSQKVRW
jgi:hypothetical protein